MLNNYLYDFLSHHFCKYTDLNEYLKYIPRTLQLLRPIYIERKNSSLSGLNQYFFAQRITIPPYLIIYYSDNYH